MKLLSDSKKIEVLFSYSLDDWARNKTIELLRRVHNFSVSCYLTIGGREEMLR